MNEYYNYYEAVTEDVKNYIKENLNIDDWKDDLDDLENYLNENLFNDDSVTGNASGSYFCNSYKAEECLSHNWDILADAVDEFGYVGENFIRHGAETMDVIIRCYCLPEAILVAINDIYE